MNENPPANRPVCEHHWASHCFGGLSVRLCMICHEPDWDDVRRSRNETELRLYEGEQWATRAHDSGIQYYCWDHEVPVREVTLRRIGWIDQKGRVYKEMPSMKDFDGGSLDALLINPGCD
jgi:hypothetical protein